MPEFGVIEQPAYSPEVKVQIDAVENNYQGAKWNLIAQHNILGARVRNEKDTFSVEDLRAYERQVFDPDIAVLSKRRFGDKAKITKAVEEK